MSRTHRLLELIQILRMHRYPVTAAFLADELGISQRTLYRDIATLQAQGADITGERGVGYLLRPGFLLPPLMFSTEEIEALVLGSRWVIQRGDERLAKAARAALSKIDTILPVERQQADTHSGLLVPPSELIAEANTLLPDIRSAIRQEYKLEIDYQDAKGEQSTRIVWPIAVGFFDQVRLLVAWCELRQDFRSFRTDRINRLQLQGSRYPQNRARLLHMWRKQLNTEQCVHY